MNAYKNLTKLNHETQEQECFFPLRVVGLAYELGHKLVHKSGLLQLTAEHLRKVDVSGDCSLLWSATHGAIDVDLCRVLCVKCLVS